MLFAALAPAVSQAMAASHTDIWTQICSVSGPAMVKVSVADTAVPASGEHADLAGKHCPFCATHAGAFALPPSAGFSVPVISSPSSHPLLFFQSPHPLAIWTVAQSRALPATV